MIIPKIFVYQQTNGLFSKCFGSQMWDWQGWTKTFHFLRVVKESKSIYRLCRQAFGCVYKSNSVLFEILLVISDIYVVVCSYWIISSGNGDMKSRVGCVSNNATINVMLRHDSTRNVLYLLSIRNDLLKKWYFQAFQTI